MVLKHGGGLNHAIQTYGQSPENWVDLSTGISPWSWPVPSVPLEVWQRLPEAGSELEAVAGQYYGCAVPLVVATPGSQYALRTVPQCVPKTRVAVPMIGYFEHALAWRDAGHDVLEYDSEESLDALLESRAVASALVINPNNPTAHQFSAQALDNLLRRVQANGGYLVIDEAFVDCDPQHSLAPRIGEPGLVVYRSLGKFFGLAGLRLGFLLATETLCERMRRQLGPWAVSHPAQWIGVRALSDIDWCIQQRSRVSRAGELWLQWLMTTLDPMVCVGTPFFITASGLNSHCHALYEALARRAVLVRHFDIGKGQGLLRFGLPPPSASVAVKQRIVDAIEEVECLNT